VLGEGAFACSLLANGGNGAGFSHFSAWRDVGFVDFGFPHTTK
jgi:hypothetical protein